jgi:hypothetical protein
VVPKQDTYYQGTVLFVIHFTVKRVSKLTLIAELASVAALVLLLVNVRFCFKKRKFLMIAAIERYPTYRFLDIAVLLHQVICSAQHVG